MLTIHLNGEKHTLESPCTVTDLLESLGLKDKPVVVELNGVALFPREYHTALIEENATIEIISIVAGG